MADGRWHPGARVQAAVFGTPCRHQPNTSQGLRSRKAKEKANEKEKAKEMEKGKGWGKGKGKAGE